MVGYDETVDRYVFMDTSTSLIANEAIMKITDNGRLKYNELPEVLQELYDEAVECVKECFDKPELMIYQQSADFAAKRLAAEQVLRGE